MGQNGKGASQKKVASQARSGGKGEEVWLVRRHPYRVQESSPARKGGSQRTDVGKKRAREDTDSDTQDDLDSDDDDLYMSPSSDEDGGRGRGNKKGKDSRSNKRKERREELEDLASTAKIRRVSSGGVKEVMRGVGGAGIKRGGSKRNSGGRGNEEEDEEMEGEAGEEGMKDMTVRVPAGVSAEDVQELINQRLLDAEVDGETAFEGGISQKGKMILRKRMDIRTWKRVFQDGDLVKRRMLRCARMVFARYFFIPDEEKVNIIQVVCTDTYGDKFKLDSESDGYIHAFRAIGTWCSNWTRLFHKEVKTLVKQWGLRHLEADDQPLVYGNKWSYELWFSMSGGLGKMVDWRTTFLESEEVEAMFKTFFTWACVWEHRSVWGPADVRISREDYLHYCRCALWQENFLDISVDDLVWLPAKPIGATRKPAKNGRRSHLEPIPGFSVLPLGYGVSGDDANVQRGLKFVGNRGVTGKENEMDQNKSSGSNENAKGDSDAEDGGEQGDDAV